MKALIVALLVSTVAQAHFIEGVQILPGKVSTKTRVNNVKTECTVEIGKVKNLMEEDQYGNPAFKVDVRIELDGGGVFASGSKKIRFERKTMMTNMFEDGVRDLEFQGSEMKLAINREGRLVSAAVPYLGGTAACQF